MNNRLIENIIRKIKRYEKYYISIHDEKWKNKMIRMALKLMNEEKNNDFKRIIDSELNKLKPCATTRIQTLKDIKSKII